MFFPLALAEFQFRTPASKSSPLLLVRPSPSIAAKTSKATKKLDITLKKEILLSNTLVAPQTDCIDSLRTFLRILQPEFNKRFSSLLDCLSVLSRPPFLVYQRLTREAPGKASRKVIIPRRQTNIRFGVVPAK
jgi:hypothetical protein